MEEAMSVNPMVQRGIALALSLATLCGCSDRITPFSSPPTAPTSFRSEAAPSVHGTSTVRWSAITRDVITAKVGAAKPSQNAAFRIFAYLALAQYRAAVAAHASRGMSPHASSSGAVAGAS